MLSNNDFNSVVCNRLTVMIVENTCYKLEKDSLLYFNFLQKKTTIDKDQLLSQKFNSVTVIIIKLRLFIL